MKLQEFLWGYNSLVLLQDTGYYLYRRNGQFFIRGILKIWRDLFYPNVEAKLRNRIRSKGFRLTAERGTFVLI